MRDRKPINKIKKRLGKEKDIDLAREYNLSREYIRQLRKKHYIPKFKIQPKQYVPVEKKKEEVVIGRVLLSHWAKRLYTLKEASTYLAMSLSQLRLLIRTGEIPVVRIGETRQGKIYIDVLDLNKFIKRHKR